MNNKDILNELHNDGENCMPSERLDPIMIEQSLYNVHRKNYKGVAGLCISLGIVCFTLIGVGIAMVNQPSLQIKTNRTETYDNIYKIVKSVKKENEKSVIFDSINSEFSKTENTAEAIDDSAASSITNSDYSETNVQVQGVDEADLVKTDGEYIYSVCGKKVLITSPNNGSPLNISSIECETDISDIYVYEDKLVALSETFLDAQYSLTDIEGEFSECTSDNTITKVYTYDLSNINAPVEISALIQSGNYLSSRKIDNVVYLTTSYYVYDYDIIEKDKPETYCPIYSTGESIKCVDPENIVVSEDVSNIEYVTVASIDLNNPQGFTDICSVLGSGSEIYSSQSNLYVTSYSNYSENKNHTQIMRFSLNNAEITKNGSFIVDGSLLNQFSMDEYNGYFRVVTEVAEYGSFDGRFYEDIMPSNDSVKTSLYIFDSELNLAGKTEDVAEEEHVKSVRFDGDVAYFVTFRQTDPLFTVDISDPYSPKILSELKIPGFSEYLHIFSDNLLLGFGREADIETGGAEGLKLTMFDISDKTNVTETATRIFTDQNAYSMAEYDHKAIFVDEKKGIIGIPYQLYTDNVNQCYYDIFQYDTQRKDFVLCKKIIIYDYNEYLYYENSKYVRGLYIDNYFYVVTPDKIYTLDYNTFEQVNELYIEQAYDWQLSFL